MKTTVYRDGKLVSSPAQRAAIARANANLFLPTPKVSDSWNWMPPHRLALLVEKAVAAAKISATPPPDEPMIDDIGVPWCNKSGYAQMLVDELSDRIFDAVAGLDGDGPGTAMSIPAKSGGMGASPPCSEAVLNPN